MCCTICVESLLIIHIFYLFSGMSQAMHILIILFSEKKLDDYPAMFLIGNRFVLRFFK